MIVPQEETWSYNGAREMLDGQTMSELVEIKEVFDDLGGWNKTKKQREERLEPLGWDVETTAKFSAQIQPDWEGETGHELSREADFDAYKPGIALEHEAIEMMRAVWHLSKMYNVDLGHHQNGLEVDVGVLLIPKGAIASDDSEKQAGLQRVRETIRTMVKPISGFSTPLFVWEYTPEY